MRRAFLAFLCVGLLAVAGSVLMAQTDTEYGSTDQPAADTMSTTGSQSDATTGAQSDTSTGAQSDTSTGTRQGDTNTDTTHQTPTVQDQSTLPATASNVPLLFAIGLSSLGALVLMRVYRNRYAR